ncbi:MAG: VOC family protein [Gammaproteobacteria bacterium]
MSIQFLNLHHASLIVSDTATSLKFYRHVLGLKQIERPPLPFPGAWLQVGESGVQQIHLLELDNPDPTTGRPQHGGRDRHVALTVASLNPVLEALESNRVHYTLSISGRRALFCRDPDGNAIEIIEQIQ